jgi:hypothetical protein
MNFRPGIMYVAKMDYTHQEYLGTVIARDGDTVTMSCHVRWDRECVWRRFTVTVTRDAGGVETASRPHIPGKPPVLTFRADGETVRVPDNFYYFAP